MSDLIHVVVRAVLKCAQACSGAEVIDNAFVEGTCRSTTLVHFHAADWVREHMTYLPELLSDGDEVARIWTSDGLWLDFVVRPKVFRAGESRGILRVVGWEKLRGDAAFWVR